MGEGDVKFIGCIGAFTGWQGAIFSLFGGACAGLILLLPFLLIQKLRPANKDNEAEDHEIQGSLQVPFGPMLALGAILYIFLFKESTDLYFQNIWLFLSDYAKF